MPLESKKDIRKKNDSGRNMSPAVVITMATTPSTQNEMIPTAR
jgi:hypothetical protein